MKLFALLTAAALAITACGVEASGQGLPSDPNAPLVQITSEGGFAPVEGVLGRGPTYTLLADGRLIYEGPVIAIYPGPLLPNYQISRIDDDQMSRVIDLVDAIGLPEITYEIDDSAAGLVADATTEVVTYWDEAGEHTYAVYALGIEPDPADEATAALAELLELFGQLTAEADEGSYIGDQVRVVAGPAWVDPDFEETEDWPLPDSDFSDWEELPNGWTCKVYGPEVLGLFTDANQATSWIHPDPGVDSKLKLLVRPLHPGEPDCPQS